MDLVLVLFRWWVIGQIDPSCHCVSENPFGGNPEQGILNVRLHELFYLLRYSLASVFLEVVVVVDTCLYLRIRPA
jgi:hypothetical protein